MAGFLLPLCQTNSLKFIEINVPIVFTKLTLKDFNKTQGNFFQGSKKCKDLHLLAERVDYLLFMAVFQDSQQKDSKRGRTLRSGFNFRWFSGITKQTGQSSVGNKGDKKHPCLCSDCLHFYNSFRKPTWNCDMIPVTCEYEMYEWLTKYWQIIS